MQFTVNSTLRFSKKNSTRGRETQPCFNLILALTELAQIVQISTYYYSHDITEEKMSDIEGILTLKFIETVENGKKIT